MKLNIQLFAVTKKTTFSEPELTSEMISGNYSTLKITINFSANNSQTFFTSKTLKCTCNGEEQSKSVSLTAGGSVNKTFTFTNIEHDIDGTKSVSWSWSIATGTSVLGTLKDSGTRTLQTIPRASELSVPSGTHYFGSNIELTVKSQTFTKNIVTYSVFGQQIGSVDFGYFLPNGSKTRSIYFPLSLITNIPDSASATARITCKTIYGVEGSPLPETEIGTSTLDIPLQVPLDTKPSATIGTLAEANSTMQSLNWGVYVQNKSQLSIPITANGIYNSKITSIKITTNGKTQIYTPTTPATTISYTFTTSVLTTSGSNTISVEVTDSRGAIGTASTTYTVQAYSKPKIETTTKAERVDADNDNSYLKYTFVASVTNVGENASATTYKIGYKLRNDSTYTYISSATFTGTSTLNKTNQTISTPLFSKNNTYDIDFYVKDAFSDSETHVYKELEAEGDLMNFNASGKAMAIGKVSEAGSNEELLEIALPTRFYEPLKGEVVVDSIRSKNMFDKNMLISSCRFGASGEEVYDTGTVSGSYFIEVKPNTQYATSFALDWAQVVCLYNSSKQFIQRFNSGDLRTFTTTSETKYIRVSIYNTNKETAQIEEGSTATTYYPYQNLDGYKTIDFETQVAFNETRGSFCQFKKIGNLVVINYQGEAKTHSANDVLFTLPQNYRPSTNIVFPFTEWDVAYGAVVITTSGSCFINQISSTTARGRIVFNISYTTD